MLLLLLLLLLLLRLPSFQHYFAGGHHPCLQGQAHAWRPARGIVAGCKAALVHSTAVYRAKRNRRVTGRAAGWIWRELQHFWRKLKAILQQDAGGCSKQTALGNRWLSKHRVLCVQGPLFYKVGVAMGADVYLQGFKPPVRHPIHGPFHSNCVNEASCANTSKAF